MSLVDSHSPVDKGVIVGRCRISCLLFAHDLVLLASSERSLQYAPARFSAACDQAKTKLSLKMQKYYVFPETKLIQQVETFKYLRVVFMSDRWKNKFANYIICDKVRSC